MKIAIMKMFDSSFSDKNFYNMQELGLAKALSKHNIEVMVLLPHIGASTVHVEVYDNNIKFVYIPAQSIGSHVWISNQVLNQFNLEIVLLESDNQIFVPKIMRYCKHKGITCFNYIGTIYSDTNNKIKSIIMGILAMRNIKYYKKGMVFAKTEWIKNILKSKGVYNVDILPVGLDIEKIPHITKSKEELRKEWGLPIDKDIILYVGRLEIYKAPLEVLEMLHELDGRYCLIAVGDGNLKEKFIQKISCYGMQHRVFYFEKIDNKKIHELYRCCDYFVNMNSKEIFGMSILEAMYQECVVIARHAPGPDDIIENGKSGFLVDTAYEMKEHLSKDVGEVGNLARTRILSKFTWDCSARILIERSKIVR